MRKYVQPAVESEEMLEQTSLACNVTSVLEEDYTCMSTYRKSETSFDEELQCRTILLDPTCMVALS
ncbi:MAG: hypothetical protein JW918_05320 [Anaerolineae bacterium]|nr:hypothetical protein [Anaerolineae bacterium]